MASSKSLMNLLTFSFGSAIGFFLCYLLFSMILEEQVEIQPHILHNDPHGQHSEDTDNNQLQGQMNFNADSGQHRGILLHLIYYIISTLFMHHKLPSICSLYPFHAPQTAKYLHESFSFCLPVFRLHLNNFVLLRSTES